MDSRCKNSHIWFKQVRLHTVYASGGTCLAYVNSYEWRAVLCLCWVKRNAPWLLCRLLFRVVWPETRCTQTHAWLSPNVAWLKTGNVWSPVYTYVSQNGSPFNVARQPAGNHIYTVWVEPGAEGQSPVNISRNKGTIQCMHVQSGCAEDMPLHIGIFKNKTIQDSNSRRILTLYVHFDDN